MNNSDIKILLVDDEPDILEIVGYNLKNEGYSVYTACNGIEACRRPASRGACGGSGGPRAAAAGPASWSVVMECCHGVSWSVVMEWMIRWRPASRRSRT